MNRAWKTAAAFVISAILAVAALIYIFSNTMSISHVLNKSMGNTSGPITQNRTYVQSFTSEENNLCSVGVLLATYARTNDSNIVIQLIDGEGEAIASENVYCGTIAENSYLSLSFPAISDSAGRQYSILMYSDAVAENAVTAWMGIDDSYSGGVLTIDGVDTGTDIAFQVSYSDESARSPLAIICGVLAVLIITLYMALSMKETAALPAKVIYWLLFSLSAAFTAANAYTVLAYTKGVSSCISIFTGVGFYRTMLFLMALLPISSFVFFDWKKVSDFLFHRRWWIALAVFVVLVSNKITLSNVSMYDHFIQPDIKTEYTEPLFGVERPIRSDEWLVDLTRKASAEYTGYGAENDIVRGTYNTNLAASGLQIGYSGLSNPLYWGYYLFGTEYGNSFYWVSLLILSFMTSFELCYIISNKSRLAALFGAAAIGLSQYMLWWSVIQYFFSAQAVIVCAYYFFGSQKMSHKILLALGTALSGANFICALYPAFQVPIAYILIALAVWVVIDRFNLIKKMKKRDWIIIGCAFAFMVSIVAVYLFDNRFYMQSVMTTVYPGSRRSSGGYSLNKLMEYFQTLCFPLKDTGNNSEAGIAFNLFPIPLIMMVYSLIYQIIAKVRNRESKIDVLNSALLIVSILLLAFCTVGIPDWLAKITLLDYSIPERCVDWIAIIMIYSMVRHIGTSTDKHKLPAWIGVLISGASVLFGVYMSNRNYPGFMPTLYIAALSIITFAFICALLCKTSEKFHNAAVLSLTAVIGLSGLCVSPVTKGLDALRAKPCAEMIRQISENDPDAVWAAYNSLIADNYIIANGGKCITSINYIPNMELWTRLDKENQYEEVYNRYAHISLNFTTEQTSFVLNQPDTFTLMLNYDDISECGIDYIFSQVPLESLSDKLVFNVIYQEDGVFIYQVENILA